MIDLWSSIIDWYELHYWWIDSWSSIIINLPLSVSVSLSLCVSVSVSLSLLHMLMTALRQNWLHADTSLSLSFCPPVRVCLFLSPFVSIFVYLSVCLYMSVSLSLSVSICLSLYLSVSLCRCVCVCVCLCLCFCLSLVIWFRHEFISVCVSGGPDSTDHRADFLTFYFFNEDITYVCNICGVGVTYKMVWSKYQNCIRYVSYVTYHTHTHIYIYIYIYILVHSAHTAVPHSFMLMSAFA